MCLADVHIEYSALVYLAIAVPICLTFTVITRQAILSGVVGSVIAVSLACLFRHLLPFGFAVHAEHFIISPLVGGTWRLAPLNALYSFVFHLGAPLMFCIVLNDLLRARERRRRHHI